jgi:integrase
LLILTGAEIGQLSRTEIVSETITVNGAEIIVDSIALTGARTKNGEPHDIPLSKPAVELLKNIARIAASDFVFTTNGKTSISG